MKLSSVLILLFALFAVFTVAADPSLATKAIKTELKQSEAAIQDLTDSVRMAKEETSAKVASLASEVESLKKTIAALQKENSDLKVASASVNTSSFDQRISKLDQIVAALRVQVADLRTTIVESSVWDKVVKFYEQVSTVTMKYYAIASAKAQDMYLNKIRPQVKKFAADATPVIMAYYKKAVDFATPYVKIVKDELKSSPLVQMVRENGLDFKKYNFDEISNLIKASLNQRAVTAGQKLGALGVPAEHTFTAGYAAVVATLVVASFALVFLLSFLVKTFFYILCCCPSNKKKTVVKTTKSTTPIKSTYPTPPSTKAPVKPSTTKKTKSN